MSKIYSYAEFQAVAKVGDVVRAVKGKSNYCSKIRDDGSTTAKITEVTQDGVYINDCNHSLKEDGYLEVVETVKTWETLQAGDLVIDGLGRGKVLAVLGDVFLISCSNDFDRANKWLTKQEVQRLGNTIVQDEVPEVVEQVTLDQVYEKFGKKVTIKQ